MPGKTATLALFLTEEARARLSALTRSPTAQAHHVERSPIILHLVDQHDATEIAAKLRIDRQWVTRCQRRVRAVGPLKAIDDLPRSERWPHITEAARTWLIGEACVKAKERGHPHELWTLRLLAAHARARCRSHLPRRTRAQHGVPGAEQPASQAAQCTLLSGTRDPAFEERKGEGPGSLRRGGDAAADPGGRLPGCRALLR